MSRTYRRCGIKLNILASTHRKTVYFADTGVARASAMLIYPHVDCASRNPRALVSTKYPRFWTDPSYPAFTAELAMGPTNLFSPAGRVLIPSSASLSRYRHPVHG